jgi:hypothetical protein
MRKSTLPSWASSLKFNQRSLANLHDHNSAFPRRCLSDAPSSYQIQSLGSGLINADYSVAMDECHLLTLWLVRSPQDTNDESKTLVRHGPGLVQLSDYWYDAMGDE